MAEFVVLLILQLLKDCIFKIRAPLCVHLIFLNYFPFDCWVLS